MSIVIKLKRDLLYGLTETYFLEAIAENMSAFHIFWLQSSLTTSYFDFNPYLL